MPMPLPRLHPTALKRWTAERAAAAPSQPSFEDQGGTGRNRHARFTVRIEVSPDDRRRGPTAGRLSRRCGNCHKPFYPSGEQHLCPRCIEAPERFRDPYSELGIVVFDSQWGIDVRAQYGLPLTVPTAAEVYTHPVVELRDEQHERRPQTRRPRKPRERRPRRERV